MAKAWTAPGLSPERPFADAAGRIIITRWHEMMSYVDGTLAGEDLEELHAMRVSSRRLRAAMDAFADAFPRRSFRRHLAVVKEITDTLGDARDLDVAIASLEAMLGDAAPEDAAGLQGLIARYREERERETPVIAELFARLERDRFERRFERWVKRHTGIDAATLAPGPPTG